MTIFIAKQKLFFFRTVFTKRALPFKEHINVKKKKTIVLQKNGFPYRKKENHMIPSWRTNSSG